ncbi:MAG: antibiotic biosynthesis monooxygenase [Acidobacteriia bacterium]|nr:antibiotic biosynthesis monooxygenase [Terriglobia bacterium]
MIARIWHGATPAAKAEAYYRFLQRSGLPGYRQTPGNRGVVVLRKIENGQAHFLLVSYWDSMAAIAAFAGADTATARYYPEDDAFLLEKEPFVQHYEVLEER